MSNIHIESLIVGGEWNITLQLIDKRGEPSWKSMHTTARDKLLTTMNEFALVDINSENETSIKQGTLMNAKHLSCVRGSTFFNSSKSYEMGRTG